MPRVDTIQPALDELGWRRVELARRLNVRPETVSRWGKSLAVPQYVREYLDSMLLLYRINKKIDRILQP